MFDHQPLIFRKEKYTEINEEIIKSELFLYAKAIDENYKKIFNHFKDKQDRLLVMNICEDSDNSVKKFNNFLGLNISSIPHKNENNVEYSGGKSSHGIPAEIAHFFKFPQNDQIIQRNKEYVKKHTDINIVKKILDDLEIPYDKWKTITFPS